MNFLQSWKHLSMTLFLFLFCAFAAEAQTGSVSGSVTGGGMPLDGFVKLIPISVQTTTKTVALTSGSYTFSNVADGIYIVQTFEAQKNGTFYIDELYSDVPCFAGNCPVLLGISITVSSGSAVSNINFDLSLASEIRGTVVGPSGPTAGLTVNLYNKFGGFHASTEVNSVDGSYAITGLAADTYYVGATSNIGLIPELYNDQKCMLLSACDRTESTPVAVSPASVTSGIDFSLDGGSQVSGLVLDKNSGAPVPNAFVNVVSSNGTTVAIGRTDSNGGYITNEGLLPGTYYAYVQTAGYFGQYYKNIACFYASCFSSASPSTPIEVTNILDITGVDFSLYPNGVGRPDLKGTITRAKLSKNKINLTYALKNIGTNIAHTSTVRFFLSKTSTLSGKASAFKTETFTSFAPNYTSSVTVELNSRSGYRYVIAQVDPGNKVKESNEKNNISAKRFR